jgi:hypothetical protein
LAVEAVCFGAGSVGSSMVYALLLADAAGWLTVVYPDRLSRRNQLRYPLWLDGARRPKARWLQEATAGSRLSVRGQEEPAAAFIRHMPDAPDSSSRPSTTWRPAATSSTPSPTPP